MSSARIVNLVMLTLLVFWTSGPARLVHEHVAHGPSDTFTIGHADSADDDDGPLGAASPVSQPHQHPHDHAACETCVAIALMAAMIVVIVADRLLGGVLPFTPSRPARPIGSRVVLHAITNRGPPVLA